MRKLIVNVVVGLVLFVGSLVGGLAATGRLDHEGVADIPLLNRLFPVPPAASAGHAQGERATVDADHAGGRPGALEAGASPAQEPGGPRRTKTGRSIENPDGPPESRGAAASYGADGSDETEELVPPAPTIEPGLNATTPTQGTGHPAEQDFQAREVALARERANRYAPGGYFTFPGMPSSLTADELNEAWQRVQSELTDLEQRKTALDLRQKELEELADDVGRRHLELARLREELATAQRALDDRIAKFQEQVKLVRNDEVAALRRNAQTLESFEASKAAELVTEQWGSEEGQAEILKTFEFMNKDKVNEIIQELANPLIQDVLKKRLTVSKEAAPSANGRK